MKFLFVLVPNLLPLCLALVLSAHTPSPQSQAIQFNAEIRELHRELNRIAGRLSLLEAEGHHVVPRGIGPATSFVSTRAITTRDTAPDMSARANPARTLPPFTAADEPAVSLHRRTTNSPGRMAPEGTRSEASR